MLAVLMMIVLNPHVEAFLVENKQNHECIAQPWQNVGRHPCLYVGLIPKELGDLSALKKLGLNHNNLRGEL